MTKMANIIYQNNLRTEAEHIASGENFFTDASAEKIMDSKPRRIKEIIISIGMSKDIEKKDRKRLENAALSCPVHKSLHPDLVKKIRFIYS